jgi:hypothetical protein
MILPVCLHDENAVYSSMKDPARRADGMIAAPFVGQECLTPQPTYSNS